MRPARDDGSTLPLILVFLAIAAGFVVVTAGATALHLERLRLLTVADGAALAAAESLPVAAGLADLRLVEARTPEGRTALVRLTATWHPPISSSLLPIAVPITVVSTASARFR